MAISLTNEKLSLTSSNGISIQLTSVDISLTESQVPVGTILYWQNYNTGRYDWVSYKVPSFGTWLVIRKGADNHSLLSSGATIVSQYGAQYISAILLRGE